MSLSPFSIRHKVAVSTGAVLALMALFGLQTADAQDDAPDEVVIFVLDLSGSMNEPFDNSRSKLDVAKAAFVEAFTNVSPDARVGLRTYGDQLEPTAPDDREESCSTDTRIVAVPAPLQREQLIDQVQGFTARGDTPMALALEKASADIPAGATGTIVLFSDGRDECFDADLDGDAANGPSFGQDPCAVAESITSRSSAVDRVVTVGFRADSAAETELRCIAEATGGSYTSIESPSDARDALPELLVQLSAPREAQRFIGREIVGASSLDADPPSFERLDDVGVDQILYTDSIEMNTAKVYRFDDFGPEAGTLTATVFGLPAQADIEFDLSAWVPDLNRGFFEGEHADTNAGLPARPTASIRCTECQISGGPHDVLWVLRLQSTNPEITGTYEIEVLTEGEAFGGTSSSCTAPQACFYPREVEQLREQLAQTSDVLAGDTDALASQALLDERDALRESTVADQERIALAEARTLELDERIATAPAQGNTYRLPMLMVGAGALLAFAPVDRLRRNREDDSVQDELVETDGPAPPAAEPTAAAAVEAEKAGPSLDVGPPPAISPNRKGSGNNWDAELEAAKAALAEQLPERPAMESATPEALAMPASSGSGLAEAMAQRQEQQAAEQQAIAQDAIEQEVTEHQAAEQPAIEQQAIEQPAAQQQAAAQQPAAHQQAIAPEQAAAHQQASAASTLEAGWYQDPGQPDQYRWWDGQGWTEHTSKPGEQ